MHTKHDLTLKLGILRGHSQGIPYYVTWWTLLSFIAFSNIAIVWPFHQFVHDINIVPYTRDHNTVLLFFLVAVKSFCYLSLLYTWHKYQTKNNSCYYSYCMVAGYVWLLSSYKQPHSPIVSHPHCITPSLYHTPIVSHPHCIIME